MHVGIERAIASHCVRGIHKTSRNGQSFSTVINTSCHIDSREARHDFPRQLTEERKSHALTSYIKDTTDLPVFATGNIASKTVSLFDHFTLLVVFVCYNFFVRGKLVTSIYILL